MANAYDLRAASNRLRTATMSLTDPEDKGIVRQYLRELEVEARQEEANETRRVARQNRLRGRSDRDEESESNATSQITPLTRSPIRGYIQRAPLTHEGADKWIFRIGVPTPPK